MRPGPLYDSASGWWGSAVTAVQPEEKRVVVRRLSVHDLRTTEGDEVLILQRPGDVGGKPDLIHVPTASTKGQATCTYDTCTERKRIGSRELGRVSSQGHLRAIAAALVADGEGVAKPAEDGMLPGDEKWEVRRAEEPLALWAAAGRQYLRATWFK